MIGYCKILAQSDICNGFFCSFSIRRGPMNSEKAFDIGLSLFFHLFEIILIGLSK